MPIKKSKIPAANQS
jgi:hypothetical protein